MEHWVKVKFDYCGDVNTNHVQEIKTNHYYRENDDGTVLHIKVPKMINLLGSLVKDHIIKSVTQEEFEKVLKDTIEYMDINITNHKFIKDGKE
jgi:hypothetical protein